MFRVVVKANMSGCLANRVVRAIGDSIAMMDKIFTKPEHKGRHATKHKKKHYPAKHTAC